MGTEVNGAEVLLGRGKVYIDRLTSSFARTGEVFVGNVSAFEVTPSPEEIKKFSSATAAAPQTCSDVIRQSLALRIVGDEFSAENLARALYGDTSTVSQTGSSVAAEAMAGVQQGRYYPTVYRDIDTIVVEPSGGGTPFTITTDYLVDEVEGRIYIVEGGGIADDDDIEVDYNYGTIALNTVRGMNQTSIRCYIRFVGDPARGATQTLEIWRASVRADGAIGLISDDYGEWTLTGDIESDATNHPDEPHFRIIRVVEPS